jgi:hypothetical protein
VPDGAEQPSESDEFEETGNDFVQDAGTDRATGVQSEAPPQPMSSRPLKVAKTSSSVKTSQPCTTNATEASFDAQYWETIFDPFPEAFKEHVLRERKSMTRNLEAS